MLLITNEARLKKSGKIQNSYHNHNLPFSLGGEAFSTFFIKKKLIPKSKFSPKTKQALLSVPVLPKFSSACDQYINSVVHATHFLSNFFSDDYKSRMLGHRILFQETAIFDPLLKGGQMKQRLHKVHLYV